MTSLILAGLGIAGTAFVARLVVNNMKHLKKHVAKLPSTSSMLTSYYKGGFEPKMTQREAALILGETSCYGQCVCVAGRKVVSGKGSTHTIKRLMIILHDKGIDVCNHSLSLAS